MKTLKKVGIWVDNTIARVMEFSDENFKVITINSGSQSIDNLSSSKFSDSEFYNREKKEMKPFFKKLINIIKDFDEIVLFGSTNAKTELYNLIREEHKFDHLNIDTRQTDKLSFEDQNRFTKTYFSRLLDFDIPYN